MRKITLIISVIFISAGSICSAAEPSKPKESLNQRASDAVKDIGDNMNKAGAAIKNSNVGNHLETDAKHALQTVESGADKAEHAIVTTVKGMGKQPATKSGAPKPVETKKGSAAKENSKGPATKPVDTHKGPSLDQSMKELGKNAEKAGTAMENGVKKLGSEAGKQVGKADQEIKKKTGHK